MTKQEKENDMLKVLHKFGNAYRAMGKYLSNLGCTDLVELYDKDSNSTYFGKIRPQKEENGKPCKMDFNLYIDRTQYVPFCAWNLDLNKCYYNRDLNRIILTVEGLYWND